MPWYENSYPLNRYFSSQAPNVVELASELADIMRAQPGVRHRRDRLIEHLVNLIANFVISAHLRSEESGIGLHLGEHANITNRRQNPLQIKPNYLRTIKRELQEQGLIEVHAHTFNLRTGTGRTTQVRPTEALRTRISDAAISPMDMDAMHTPAIELREKTSRISRDIEFGLLAARSTTHEVEFEYTEDLEAMADDVIRYRRLLHRSDIILPERDYPLLRYEKDSVRRVFTFRSGEQETFDYGGRVVAAAWQSIPGSRREEIIINGSRVVELDYRSMATTQLYARERVPIPDDDVYSLTNLDSHFRPLVKKIQNTAINARNLRQALTQVIDSTWGNNDDPELLQLLREIDSDVEVMMDIFEQLRCRHQAIAHYLGTGEGRKLMREESDISMRIIRQFAEDHQPILCVHDSFITTTENAGLLEQSMTEAFTEYYDYCPYSDRSQLVTYK